LNESAELEVILGLPAHAEVVMQIERIPSVLEVLRSPDRAATLRVLLEPSADIEETAYLIECIPDVREVLE
jgi:hypothetical protein